MLLRKKIENNGTEAVKRLRLAKLADGLPFMINSKDLPINQCYLEYPDGVIKIVKISPDRRDFEIVRELSKEESQKIRKKLLLLV